ncbi:MAG: anti-sigma regulatory factor [Carboxydocellales bacterium]
MTDKIHILAEQDIIVARRIGRALAKDLGFSLVDQSRIVISISELSRNIFQYAGKGTIQIQAYKAEVNQGIEIIAEDCGPGILDTKLALLDTFSTSKSLGMGLPGIQRLMNEFHLTSTYGSGTSITVRKWLSNKE